jgi:hypothetical protein
MAAQETTFDAVASAAQTLLTEGKSVSVGSLRDVLGAVAPASIFQHLTAWRASQAQPVDPQAWDVPGTVHDALNAWAQRLNTEATARHRDNLSQMQGDLNDLLALHAQADSVCAQLTAERDQALARVTERDARIERMTVELRHAREIASEALVGKAKDQLAIDGKDTQVAELRSEIERHLAAVAAASDARLAAQMELVGAVTARDNYAAELAELRAQLEASQLS